MNLLLSSNIYWTVSVMLRGQDCNLGEHVNNSEHTCQFAACLQYFVQLELASTCMTSKAGFLPPYLPNMDSDYQRLSELLVVTSP